MPLCEISCQRGPQKVELKRITKDFFTKDIIIHITNPEHKENIYLNKVGGEIKIVSAGGEDRGVFVFPSDLHLIIRADGIDYRIDTDADWVAAYMKISGVSEQAALKIIDEAPAVWRATYKKGSKIIYFETDPGRIESGVFIARNGVDVFPWLTNHEAVAATLTADEWAFS